MKLLLSIAALFKPSKASPPLNEPSPISAITLYLSPFISRALATPDAKLSYVDVWPKTNVSCSDSDGLKNPEMFFIISPTNPDLRPVSILWV